MPRLVLDGATPAVAATARYTVRPTRPGVATATAAPSACALSAKSSKRASAKPRVGVTLPTFSAQASSVQASVAAAAMRAAVEDPARAAAGLTARRRPGRPRSTVAIACSAIAPATSTSVVCWSPRHPGIPLTSITSTRPSSARRRSTPA